MEAGADEDGVAILRSNGDVAREIGRVEALERETFLGAIDAVVVDFVEVHFRGGIVDVVFVGREAGPVAAGSVDLDDDEFVGWEVRTDDVHDLAGSVSTATEAANNVFWSDEFRLKLGLGRDATFGNFAGGFGSESGRMAGGQIKTIGETVKNIFALADAVRPFAPVCGAAAAEEDEGGFFAVRGGGIGFTRIETAGGHAHPFPLDAFAGKMEQFAGLSFGERTGMDDVRSCGHQAPQAAPGFTGKCDSGKATGSAGRDQSALPCGGEGTGIRSRTLRKA